MAQRTDDQQDYIEQVFERARKLVLYRVWHDIKPQRLEAWLGCFANHDAELLAAFLLDNLSFRSKDQFLSLLDVLFADVRISSSNGPGPLLIETLRNRPKKGQQSICIAPVLGPSVPPTKSGPYILRLAQRRYRIKSEWLVWPQHIKFSDALTDVIFLDDFCGTGSQFIDFADEIGLKEHYEANPSVRFWYYVTTIHEVGMKKLTDVLPFLNVRYSERLTSIHKVLGEESFNRYKISGFQEEILEEYERVLLAVGLPSKGGLSSGFGELGLAYSYAHATPNNTLPIFWMDTPSWTPLLDR